ncbi:MAG: N-acetyl-gamma-glutamyl-phosphate reductase [Candidatus Dormibacteria bacterium]
MPARTTVAVIGATGYAGGTAIGLLARHPHVRVVRATSRSYGGQQLSDVYPAAALNLELSPDPDPGDAEVVFAALPHGLAGAMAGKWLDEGRTVVDLGADFRLRDAAAYARWYGTEHPAPQLLEDAIFALPELLPGGFRGARLLAAPGCYSTAAILALHPAAQSGLVEADFIVDAASGISGAGRSLAVGYHFAEAAEDFRAYAVTGHRHQAEMFQALARGGHPPRLTFVPHLVPMIRGILATCYLSLVDGAEFDDLLKAYRDAYSGCPFVRVVDAPPRTKEVAGTNRCHVHLALQGDRVIVTSAIDNLVKGAAGQGVQALNLAMGWAETAGLEQAPRWP